MPRLKQPLTIAMFVATVGLVATACTGAASDSPSATPDIKGTAQSSSLPRAEAKLSVLAPITLLGDLEPMRRILEEQGSFVSLIMVDTPGGANAGFAIMNGSDLEERKHLMLVTTEEQAWLATSGLGRTFPDGVLGPPTVVMKVGALGCSGVGTLDSEVLTFGDLDGKTLQGGRGPSRRMIDAATAIGIQADHVGHGGDMVTVRELKNGQVDASYYTMREHDRPAPILLELLQDRDGAFYHVDVKDAVLAVQEANPGKWPFLFPVPLFRGDLQSRWDLDVDPIRQEVAHCFGGQNQYLSASAEADFDVVYEFVFQLVSNRDQFARFLAGNVEATTETLGMTYRPQSDYHPGARRAYEELGYLYGLEGTIEHHQQRAAAHGVSFEVPRPFLDLLAK